MPRQNYRLTAPTSPDRNLQALYNICPTTLINVIAKRNSAHELHLRGLAQNGVRIPIMPMPMSVSQYFNLVVLIPRRRDKCG